MTMLIVLIHRKVLCTQVPVHVDGAEVGLVVGAGDGHTIARVHSAAKSRRHVGARLLERLGDTVLPASGVVEIVIAGHIFVPAIVGVVALLLVARVNQRVGRVLRVEVAVGRHNGEDAHRGQKHASKEPAADLDGEATQPGELSAILHRGHENNDEEDEKRGDEADNSEGEAVVEVKVIHDLDRGDDLVVARPRGSEDADSEADDNKEAGGEDKPHEGGERLGLGRRQETSEGKGVEQDH
mmetsp:Transcript_72460/g.143896  ORF Transcript_72460/g.143896 Transcript_72460/m.143896 type:complete len:240 (-) Transcript_72460:735-1454(-)